MINDLARPPTRLRVGPFEWRPAPRRPAARPESGGRPWRGVRRNQRSIVSPLDVRDGPRGLHLSGPRGPCQWRADSAAIINRRPGRAKGRRRPTGTIQFEPSDSSAPEPKTQARPRGWGGGGGCKTGAHKMGARANYGQPSGVLARPPIRLPGGQLSWFLHHLHTSRAALPLWPASRAANLLPAGGRRPAPVVLAASGARHVARSWRPEARSWQPNNLGRFVNQPLRRPIRKPFARPAARKYWPTRAAGPRRTCPVE